MLDKSVRENHSNTSSGRHGINRKEQAEGSMERIPLLSAGAEDCVGILLAQWWKRESNEV